MVKVSINRYVSQRVQKTRKEVEDGAQRLREKTIKHLEEIFRMAARVARGEIKHQRIDGKMVRITLSQRKRWLRVAEQAAKTIEKVSINIDEQEIYIQLNKLAILIHEASIKAETRKPMKLRRQKE